MTGQEPLEFVEASFSVTDPSYFFVGISRQLECDVQLLTTYSNGPGEVIEYYLITGVEVDLVVQSDAEADDRTLELVAPVGAGGLFESRGEHCSPVEWCARVGGRPRSVRAERGDGWLVADIPTARDPSGTIAAFLDAYPAFELAAKEQVEGRRIPFGSMAARRAALVQNLTDRQLEVLEGAYRAGYYDVPRTASGEEIATALGISGNTFSKHIRSAERTVLSMFFQ